MLKTWGLLYLLVSGLSFAQSPELVSKSRQAGELMAAGKFAQAIPIYEELARAVPGNAGLLMNLGMARHMAGDDRGAVAPLEAALKLQPDLPPASFLLGASYLSLGQATKAVPHLNRAVKAMPDNPDARRFLGESLRSLGRFEAAAREFEALTKLQPESPKAWFALGQSYESLAAAAFEQLSNAAPESGYFFAVLGQARSRQKQYRTAFYFYRKALERESGLRAVHSALAEIYNATGHSDWAATEREKERRLPPLDCKTDKLACEFRDGRHRAILTATSGSKAPAALYWRTLASNKLALAAFDRLARLGASVELHELMATMYRVQGQPVESAKEWREALKLAPNDPRLETELALTLHMARDHEAARPLLEKLLRRDPESAELNYLLGDVLLNQRDVEKAVPLLEKAVARNPKLLPAHASLAQAYAQLNRPRAAIPHLKAALPVDEDGSLHFQLAQAFQQAGRAGAAKELLAKYQEIRKQREAESKEAGEASQIVAP